MSDKKQTILVSCGSCGQPFGRLTDDGRAEAVDAHFQTCTDYLYGEGLKNERPLMYAFEDDDA